MRATKRSKIKLSISEIWGKKVLFSDDFVTYKKHKTVNFLPNCTDCKLDFTMFQFFPSLYNVTYYYFKFQHCSKHGYCTVKPRSQEIFFFFFPMISLYILHARHTLIVYMVCKKKKTFIKSDFFLQFHLSMAVILNQYSCLCAFFFF